VADYQAEILPFIAGDFKQVPWQVSAIPTNGQVTKAWFTVKEVPDEDPLDALKILQKEINVSLDTAQGHITNTGLVGNVATGFFNLLETETIDITPGVIMFYDIQLLITFTDLTTRISTPEKGRISTIQGVTNVIS
jgi:hypothetical protein